MQETPLEATVKYLNDVTWPADKEEVIDAAERKGAPDDMIQIIRSVDKDRLTNPNEVHIALWKAIPTRVVR